MPALSFSARIAEEVLGLLLSSRCAGCDSPGILLCDECLTGLQPRIVRSTLPTGVPLLAALPFDGVAARVIRALKQQGSTALARPLGEALASVFDQLALASSVKVVPVPTSRAAFRRRGFRVPELLIARAGLHSSRLLSPDGKAADQRGLSISAREQNVRGTMRAIRIAGFPTQVVLVDDVVTTGATLVEAERVLRAAGYEVRAAVALAATPRRTRAHAENSRRDSPYA